MTLTRSIALLCLGLVPGCAQLTPYRTPTDVQEWQDASRPTLALHAKAEAYQARLEAVHRMPDGVVRYRFYEQQPRDEYGDLPDGPFFAGLYLASQALRLHAGDAAARAEVLAALEGMALLLDVTGEPGLLARWVAPALPAPTRSPWRQSEARPGYWFRADVSKDQLAGYACGLGVAWALLPDAAIRARVAALAVPIAEHLRRNDMQIVDVDGERTTHGELRARVALVFPVGVNALIALTVAKAADAATGDDARSRGLDEAGYLRAARSAHWRPPGYAKRVNDNMAYVSLLALLLLEEDAERAARLRDVEAKLWDGVRGEHNAFFAGVHALAAGDDSAKAELRAGLADFPERKRNLPVDLTRPGFDFEARWLNNAKGLPRAKEPVPLYLRPSGSNLWVSDPYALVGSLHDPHAVEYAGVDYLLAYWLSRSLGILSPED
jgi:hypothetical protein